METPSSEGIATGNSSASSAATSVRKNRRYSREEKDRFFEARDRLGSVSAAARELGFKRSTCMMWSKDTGRAPGAAYTVGQKGEFFVLLDRLGSVSAAARELDINTQTAFGWAYSLAAVERRPRRNPTARQLELEPAKAAFLSALGEVGNIMAAAHEAGVKYTQGLSWARAAGVENVPQARSARKARYLRLREEGATQKAAAAAVGIHHRTGRKWEQAARVATINTDAFPEPEVGYKYAVTSAYAKPATTIEAAGRDAAEPVREPVLALLPESDPGPGTAPGQSPAAGDPTVPSGVGLRLVTPSASPVGIEELERVVDSRYLGHQERELIADLLHAGRGIRAIARELGRSPSTVSREIERNSHPRLGYLPHGAQRAATQARARPKPSKLAEPGKLREYVTGKLERYWSPEQISNLLTKEFPDDPQMRVSHETIYQAIYVQARGGLKREVEDALRTGRTRRKKHKSPEERTSRFRDPMINISERPAEVDDRAVPGHWEGDLITGAHNQSAIATLVERTTRYVMLVHLPADHGAEAVRDGLIRTMATLPQHLRGSLTWDQGVEMAKHKAFSLATDMDVYFCDPHSPWQRGSNENTNGLLRQYFPKGTDLSVHSPEELERVAQELNSRPRKTHNWDTPAERIRDLLIAS